MVGKSAVRNDDGCTDQKQASSPQIMRPCAMICTLRKDGCRLELWRLDFCSTENFEFRKVFLRFRSVSQEKSGEAKAAPLSGQSFSEDLCSTTTREEDLRESSGRQPQISDPCGSRRNRSENQSRLPRARGPRRGLLRRRVPFERSTPSLP